MKRYLSIIILMAMVPTIYAQNAYDAEAMAASDLNGTARYIGMGGALGALGADLSTMGSNPAGTGMLRRSEASFTFGGIFTGNPGAMEHDRGRASFDQAGILFVLGGDGDNLENINFGVNYQKKRNSLSNLDFMPNLGDGTQMQQIAGMANACVQMYGRNIDDRTKNWKNGWGLLPYMFAPGQEKDDKGNESFYEGVLIEDVTASENPFTAGVPSASTLYRRATYGTSSQVDISLSANLQSRFFAGLSVGIYTSAYTREALYDELGKDNYEYCLDHYYHNSADGVDVKLGFIVRPVEDSPFRIGLSVHTPIWYKVRDNYNVALNAWNPDGNQLFKPQTYYSDTYEYNYRTPWVFNLSLGHTVGNFLAIGAGYEFRDLGSCKYYDSSAGGQNLSFEANNADIRDNLKAQHTLRLGIEAKPDKALAVRLGYNFVSSPFKDNAAKVLTCGSTTSETDYTNWKDIHRITFGLGYRFKVGYIDIAYQYQMQKGNFYAYYMGDGKNELTSSKITNNRSQLVATLGFKF